MFDDPDKAMSAMAALRQYARSLAATLDMQVKADLLVARAGELSKVETEASGAYLRSREREGARRRRGLGPVWRAVNGAPFRRALGRATAAL